MSIFYLRSRVRRFGQTPARLGESCRERHSCALAYNEEAFASAKRLLSALSLIKKHRGEITVRTCGSCGVSAARGVATKILSRGDADRF
jgi:hypothetical protein